MDAGRDQSRGFMHFTWAVFCYNPPMNRTDKIKRITLIFLAALASGYFMYSGFSLLFNESESNTTVAPKEPATPAE